MSGPRFGAYALPSYSAETDGSQSEYMRSLVDLLAGAEELGFDAIWLNEHHFHPWGGLIPSPPVLLSALAQRTQRVTLGTSIVVLPLHNPIEIAEQLAMLDLMSNGRVQLGVGRGTLPSDYWAMGLSPDDAQERTIDGLEIILKAWSGEPFSHQSAFHSIKNLTVWPPGQQQPRPDVWISCSNNPKSFEWTGKQGYDLLTVAFPHTVAETAELTRVYKDARRDAGSSGSCQIGTLFHIVVAENGGHARELASKAFRRFQADLRSAREARPGNPPGGRPDSLSPEELIDQGRMLAGNPSEVATTLRQVRDEIGFTEAILMFQLGGLSFDLARESMQLFAAEVMPQLR